MKSYSDIPEELSQDENVTLWTEEFLRNNEKRLVRFQLIKKKINKVSKTTDQCDCSRLLAKYLNVLYTTKCTTFPFKTILYFPINWYQTR